MIDDTQKRLIEATFDAVAPEAVPLAMDFYARLFALHPELRPRFPDQIGPQAAKLADSLSAVVGSLSDAGTDLTDHLHDLGAHHARLGVRDADYVPVRDVLLDTLAATMGTGWTPAHRDAWHAVITAVGETMIEGARIDGATQDRRARA